MVALEVLLRTLVIGDALTQPVFGNRYHLNRIPDNPVYPYIRATTISHNPMYHQQGSGIGKTRIQMDVIHDNKLSGDSAADKLFQLFDGQKYTVGDYKIVTFVRNVPSSWEADQRYFRRILEVEIAYVEA